MDKLLHSGSIVLPHRQLDHSSADGMCFVLEFEVVDLVDAQALLHTESQIDDDTVCAQEVNERN